MGNVTTDGQDKTTAMQKILFACLSYFSVRSFASVLSPRYYWQFFSPRELVGTRAMF